jgi:protein-disulfide isomerase
MMQRLVFSSMIFRQLSLLLLLCVGLLTHCASMRVNTDGSPLEEPTATHGMGGHSSGASDNGNTGERRSLAGAVAAMGESERIPVQDSPTHGPSNALATLVVFSDFECSYCQRLTNTLAVIRERFASDVRVVFKHMPLSRHPHARLAAEAAIAAHAQGKFWEFHDLLFAHQDALEPADLERYAAQAGMDVARMRTELAQGTHRPRLERDIALGRTLGVSATPSSFVNGTIVQGAKRFSHFLRVLDRVLARARTISPRETVYASMVSDPVEPEPEDRPEVPPSPFDLNAVHAVSVEGAPMRGQADALVTMVIFSDFECGYCQRFKPALDALIARYGRELRVVFRHLPSARHEHAMDAAVFAEEARAQQGDSGFYRAHDWLFAHQDGLDRESLLSYAAAMQLDGQRLAAALAQQNYRENIARDGRMATELGVDATPTMFINGRRVVGARPLAELTEAVDRALTEAQALVTQGVARADVYARTTASGSRRAVFIGGPREVRVAHLLVMHLDSPRVPAGVTRTRDEARARAEQALQLIQSGRAFEDVVRAYTDEPGGSARAGDLGRFTRGRMVRAFEDAAFGLAVGQTSGIVETEFGFHILRRSE